MGPQNDSKNSGNEPEKIEQGEIGRESTVEAQLKCDCGERDLVVTWTDAVEVGERTRVEMPCSGCESLERTVTVVYDPEQYDLVTPYGDGDISLKSRCEECGHDYFGPMLRPCFECGSEEFDRYLDTGTEQPNKEEYE